jgi:hypothetical protein
MGNPDQVQIVSLHQQTVPDYGIDRLQKLGIFLTYTFICRLSMASNLVSQILTVGLHYSKYMRTIPFCISRPEKILATRWNVLNKFKVQVYSEKLAPDFPIIYNAAQ